MEGKPESAAELAASSAAHSFVSRTARLFVKDLKTGLRLLVDSGADVSIIPATKQEKMSGSQDDNNVQLFAANGTKIPTFGFKILTIDLGLRRKLQWPFVIANIDKGILGADFIKHFDLIIDLKHKRLIDNLTKLSIQGNISTINEYNVLSTLRKDQNYHDLLSEYPELTKPNLLPTTLKHDICHRIETKGLPVYAKPRQLDPRKLQQIKEEFEYMLDNKIIRPSSSEWASPLHVVTKPDGSLRPCGDYRRLNAVTVPDRYPLPRIDDFLSILPGKTIFSKIDLFKAYFQIPVLESDKCKTAITTPFGLFEFNVMSFGLRNAPATFQRFINLVLRGLPFVFSYLDDILIASATTAEHEKHLKLVFERLNQYGLRINVSKSEFGRSDITFLGFLVNKDGTKPLPDKVKAILDYKQPETIHELRTFLGLLNFYRRYLKDAADTQAILHDYLKGAKKRDKRKINWTDKAIKMFEKCKQDLANVTLLTLPNDDCQLALFTDASDVAVGSVLQQLDNGNWKPIAFYSKKLCNAQKAYSTYDRELLSIYLSIKQLKHYLEGRNFIIFTDHKPLIFAYRQKNEKASPRQLRHLQYISQFSTDIRHINGKDNIIADAMSRIERVDAMTQVIDYDLIAKAQINDDELKQLRNSDSLQFKPCELSTGNILWCDISTNNIRPYIPQPFRKLVFSTVHNLSHNGIKSTVRQVTNKFIWTNIRKDIKIWSQTCIDCQKNKITRHNKAQLSIYEEPDERFQIVHIDLIGPLPPSEGNVYCLTCIDRFTDWIEVIPIPNCTADTVAKTFYSYWITRFGVPYTIICDRGAQFQAELFKNLATLCGSKLQSTTAYHPQCNGKVERMHRTLKSALKAHNNIKWTDTLPTVLLGMRTALREDKKFTIAQMVYGTTIRIPGEFFEKSKIVMDRNTFVSDLQNLMNDLRPRRRSPKLNNHMFVHKDLATCTHVFVRIDRVKKPLEPFYEGPFLVDKRYDKYFTVNIKKKNVNISIDRLKPAFILDDNDDTEMCTKPNVHNNIKGSIPGNKNDDKLHKANNNKPKKTVTFSKNVVTKCGRNVKLPSRFLN